MTLTWGDRRQAPLCRGPQTKVSESLTVWQTIGMGPQMSPSPGLGHFLRASGKPVFLVVQGQLFLGTNISWGTEPQGVPVGVCATPWKAVRPRGGLCDPVEGCVTPWEAV